MLGPTPPILVSCICNGAYAVAALAHHAHHRPVLSCALPSRKVASKQSCLNTAGCLCAARRNALAIAMLRFGHFCPLDDRSCAPTLRYCGCPHCR